MSFVNRIHNLQQIHKLADYHLNQISATGNLPSKFDILIDRQLTITKLKTTHIKIQHNVLRQTFPLWNFRMDPGVIFAF